jgi:hypothetical protein
MTGGSAPGNTSARAIDAGGPDAAGARGVGGAGVGWEWCLG